MRLLPSGRCCCFLVAALLVCCASCNTAGSKSNTNAGQDNDNEEPNDNQEENGNESPDPLPALEISFGTGASDPLLARVRSPVQGNEYALFTSRDENGNPVRLLQVHTWLNPVDEREDGLIVIAVLDEAGRPVRFEAGDESVTVIYDDDLAIILYTAEDGEEAVIEIALSPGAEGFCGDFAAIARESSDRFDLCCLLSTYLTVVEQLFECDGGDELPVHCDGMVSEGAIGPTDICQLALPAEPVDGFDEWRTSLELQEVAPAVFAAARTTPSDEGTAARLDGLAIGVEPPAVFRWQVIDGPVTPDVPDGRTTEVVLGRPGDYTIEVTVTDADERSASSDLVVSVEPLAPVANAGPDLAALVGQPAPFDAAESFDPDGQIVTCTWDFGDGASSSGCQAEHVYGRAGDFDVSLSVTDTDGLTDTDTLAVTVSEADSFAVTIEIQGQGDTSPSPGETIVAAGALVQIVATPADGWRFVRYEGDAAGTNPTTIVMANRDLQVTVVFEEVEADPVTLDVLVFPPGSGQVIVEPAGDPPGTYSAGTELTVTAVGNSGYVFSEYSGAIASTEAVVTFAIETDAILAASFVEGPTFTLTTDVQPPGAGTIVLIPPGGIYSAGTAVDLFAVPATNFAFSSFFGDLAGANPVASVVMDQNRAVGAQFVATLQNTQISQQPQPTAVTCTGSDAEFSVRATGTDLIFVWQRDCEPDGTFEETIVDNAHFDVIDAGPTNILRIYQVDAADVCDYRCLVSGAAGDMVSAAAGLTISGGPPAITADPTPTSQTVCQGSDVVYTVTATGLGPFSYQWRRDDVSLPGETLDTLTLSNVGPGDAGTYDCEVTNQCGSVTSSQAVLSVGVELRFEAGTVSADGVGVEVALVNTYCSPVVVCTVQYDNNTIPVVPRVSQVDQDSFTVRLQNPSGGAVVADQVHYLVMEEGVWSLDGTNFEAQKYESTLTDHDTSHVGETQTYGQGYLIPVIVGQVMTENDADWSVFWSRGSNRLAPPDAAKLFTGKHVCEDPDTNRSDETIGFIVFETGHDELNGVAYEAALGSDTVKGVVDGPPFDYTFAQAFAGAPAVAIASQAAMDGANGSWAYLYGAAPITNTTISFAVDEDQLNDPERNHTTEQVGYIVFQSALVCPP